MTKTLPIVRGKFLHLTQGPAAPPKWLCNIGMRDDAEVVYLSWNESLGRGCEGITDIFFAPNSTWTNGRNQLYEKALKIQQKQGWRYEYLIFTDDDIQLFAKDGNQNPYDLVHASLSNVQPAVAGVSAKILPRNKCGPVAPCSADIDAAFAAFHATAAPMLLPYDTTFDADTWYASQAIMILLMGASMPEHVVQFNQVYYKNTLHRKYPKYRGNSDAASTEDKALKKGTNSKEEIQKIMEKENKRMYDDLVEKVNAYVQGNATQCLRDIFNSTSTPMKTGIFAEGALCHSCAKTSACENSAKCFFSEDRKSQEEVPDYEDIVKCKPKLANAKNSIFSLSM